MGTSRTRKKEARMGAAAERQEDGVEQPRSRSREERRNRAGLGLRLGASLPRSAVTSQYRRRQEDLSGSTKERCQRCQRRCEICPASAKRPTNSATSHGDGKPTPQHPPPPQPSLNHTPSPAHSSLPSPHHPPLNRPPNPQRTHLPPPDPKPGITRQMARSRQPTQTPQAFSTLTSSTSPSSSCCCEEHTPPRSHRPASRLQPSSK